MLTVGVDMQSRLLDKSDRSAYFLFGDGAGAAIVSSGTTGHRIHQAILGADTRGLHMARREEPGYAIRNGHGEHRPLDSDRRPRPVPLRHRELHRHHPPGHAKSGWSTEETRWIIPHQANGRILKAAAKRSGVGFDRFFLNVERVGNTSSASIPLALIEAEERLRPGDKLVLCSVGAGMTTAAVTVEW